jgi:uncharacterized membrane protein YphA (DoxX/SURF4 family)
MPELSLLMKTDSSSTTIFIRIMVGCVFLTEGIQKFLYPAARGAGRFEVMGFPAPEFFGPLVGSLEIVAGLLILIGFVTRLGAFITFAIMLVAIIVTKITILFGEAFGPFQVRELSTYVVLVYGSRNANGFCRVFRQPVSYHQGRWTLVT